MNQSIDVPIQNCRNISYLTICSMILYHLVGLEHVRTNLRAPCNVLLSFVKAILLFPFLLQFKVVQSGFEYLHGQGLVLPEQAVEPEARREAPEDDQRPEELPHAEFERDDGFHVPDILLGISLGNALDGQVELVGLDALLGLALSSFAQSPLIMMMSFGFLGGIPEVASRNP